MDDHNKNIDTALICRICLRKVNKSNIVQFNYLLFYEKVKHIWVHDKSLPEGVCWLCVVKLASAATFRDEALESEDMLYMVLRKPLLARKDDIGFTIKYPKLSLEDSLRMNIVTNFMISFQAGILWIDNFGYEYGYGYW